MIRRRLLFTALLALGLAATTGAVSAAELRIDNRDAGTGQGLDDPTPANPVGGNPGVTRGEQARIVFQFASDLWGAVLQSDVPVVISASFAKLSCTATSGVLGSAGTSSIFSFNAPAPAGALADTWYHSALTDALAHEEANPGKPDINANFNGSLGSTGCLEGSSWYFGLDGKQPAGSINFLNVVLHEMAHGLGFSGFGSLTTGVPLQNRQDIYTTFVYDDTQQKRWYDLTPDERKVSALNDGKLVFTGANVKSEIPLALSKPQVLRISAPAAAVGDYTINQAAFGPVASAANFSGDIVRAVTGANSEGCVALDNAAVIAGHIAMIDRGTCAFTVKVANAQAAGASAVIIANNQAGTIVPGGTPTSPVSIPVVSISLADAGTLKANLAGLTGAITLANALAGADAAGNAQLYAPTVLAQGSSFSHYDTRLTPNALMEYAINADLVGQINLDLTPALFKDEGWQLNETTQLLLNCDSGIPTWIPGGVVIGANVVATAKTLASAATTVGSYRSAILNYAAGLAGDHLISAGQASSLNACLSNTETQNQFNRWSAYAPVVLDKGVSRSGQAGAVGSSKTYQIDVPAGALGLSLRTLGGSGDVSIYVKAGEPASPANYSYKAAHAGTTAESVLIARPVAGIYYLTVVGETAYSGVTVLATYTAR